MPRETLAGGVGGIKSNGIPLETALRNGLWGATWMFVDFTNHIAQGLGQTIQIFGTWCSFINGHPPGLDTPSIKLEMNRSVAWSLKG